MNPTDMNISETDVMVENAMIPAPSPQATQQAAINVDFQGRLGLLDYTPTEMSRKCQDDEVAPCIKEAEEKRKMRAETRLHTKLRKMEVEQKEILLAEAQKSLEEARRKFESQPQVPYDYTPGPPRTIENVFREKKERNRLIALEREQKEALYNEVMEKRARECGDEWPRIQEMSQAVRFDHILKPWPGYKGLIPNYFHDHPLIPPQKSNEPPAAL
jgi:hypothetical protein